MLFIFLFRRDLPPFIGSAEQVAFQSGKRATHGEKLQNVETCAFTTWVDPALDLR
jgi:hypothetical protein